MPSISKRLSSLALACAVLASLLFGAAPGFAADDATAGQHLFTQRCAACHGTRPGENKIGPTLEGVFGHLSGSAPSFRYSPALKKAQLTWDAATLDKWLQNPSGLVHGTTMFATVASASDRQDLIAYLKTLH
jgi:cytochrome c